MSSIDQKNLIRAKEYIKAGRQDEAKAILFEMPHSGVARRWLRKLEQREKEAVQGKKDFYGVPLLALQIIITSIVIWLTATAVYLIQSGRPIVESLGIVVSLAGFIALVLFFQFVGWKFYWWMVALSWVLGTLLIIMVLFTGLASQYIQ